MIETTSEKRFGGDFATATFGYQVPLLHAGGLGYSSRTRVEGPGATTTQPATATRVDPTAWCVRDRSAPTPTTPEFQYELGVYPRFPPRGETARDPSETDTQLGNHTQLVLL